MNERWKGGSYAYPYHYHGHKKKWDLVIVCGWRLNIKWRGKKYGEDYKTKLNDNYKNLNVKIQHWQVGK